MHGNASRDQPARCAGDCARAVLCGYNPKLRLDFHVVGSWGRFPLDIAVGAGTGAREGSRPRQRGSWLQKASEVSEWFMIFGSSFDIVESSRAHITIESTHQSTISGFELI